MRPKGETEPGVRPKLFLSSVLLAKVRRDGKLRDLARDLRSARWEHSKI